MRVAGCSRDNEWLWVCVTSIVVAIIGYFVTYDDNGEAVDDVIPRSLLVQSVSPSTPPDSATFETLNKLWAFGDPLLLEAVREIRVERHPEGAVKFARRDFENHTRLACMVLERWAQRDPAAAAVGTCSIGRQGLVEDTRRSSHYKGKSAFIYYCERALRQPLFFERVFQTVAKKDIAEAESLLAEVTSQEEGRQCVRGIAAALAAEYAEQVWAWAKAQSDQRLRFEAEPGTLDNVPVYGKVANPPLGGKSHRGFIDRRRNLEVRGKYSIS